MKKHLLLLLIFILTTGIINAQDDDTLTPEAVEVEATDGLILAGDLFTQMDDAPAVLLMHMLGGNRSAWEPFITPLYDAGYTVLAVDLRGHGQTRGERDWTLAEADVQTWLDWLRTQDGVRAEAVSIVGASIGSNLALLGCANDVDCVTAIALSPGADYFGVMPSEAVAIGLAERSTLLVGSYDDGSVVEDILSMVGDAEGEIGVRFYTGRAHGTNLFRSEDEQFINMMIDWLNEHTPDAL